MNHSLLLPNEKLTGNSVYWQSLRDQLREAERANDFPLLLCLAAQMSAVAVAQVLRWRRAVA